MRRIKKRKRRKLIRFFVIIFLLFIIMIAASGFFLEIFFKAKTDSECHDDDGFHTCNQMDWKQKREHDAGTQGDCRPNDVLKYTSHSTPPIFSDNLLYVAGAIV